MPSKTRRNYRGGNVDNCKQWTTQYTKDIKPPVKYGIMGEYSKKCEVMVNNGVIFKPKPIFSTQPTPMYGDILLDTESKFNNAHKEIEYKLYEEEEKNNRPIYRNHNDSNNIGSPFLGGRIRRKSRKYRK